MGEITLLAVSPETDALASIEEHVECCRVVTVRDVSAARRLIACAGIVVCDRYLGDGDWKDVLVATERLDPAPPVVVISRTADEEFWGEVLNMGGFDVLMTPLDPSELARVVAMACRTATRQAVAGN